MHFGLAAIIGANIQSTPLDTSDELHILHDTDIGVAGRGLRRLETAIGMMIEGGAEALRDIPADVPMFRRVV